MKRLLLLLFFLAAVMSPSVFAQALTLSLLNQDPDPVNAGDIVKVKFKIENFWEDTQDDIAIEVIPEYPFSLFSGSAVQKIGRLDGRHYGENAVVTDFHLKVAGDAEKGSHPVKMRLWVGKAEFLYKDTFYLDVENEEIKLRTYVRESDFITSGKSGKVTIELANAGADDLQFVEISLLPAAGYKLLSTSNYVYIGDLDSDDTETEDFSLYVDEGIVSLEIPVRVSYEVRDKQYSDDMTLRLNLLSVDEAKKVGLIKVSYTRYIVLAVLVAVVALYVLRKLRRRQR